MQITVCKSYETLFAVKHHLHNLKSVKNSHQRVLLLVKLKAKASNFTNSTTHSWYFKLY